MCASVLDGVFGRKSGNLRVLSLDLLKNSHCGYCGFCYSYDSFQVASYASIHWNESFDLNVVEYNGTLVVKKFTSLSSHILLLLVFILLYFSNSRVHTYRWWCGTAISIRCGFAILYSYFGLLNFLSGSFGNLVLYIWFLTKRTMVLLYDIIYMVPKRTMVLQSRIIKNNFLLLWFCHIVF